MIILGLGSNIGDRLANLRQAVAHIRALPNVTINTISPIYLSDALLPDNAPPDWNKPYLNLALRCESALTPHDLLQALKAIEWRIGRKPDVRHWGPRVLDIDILAFDDTVLESDALTLPHKGLSERPFALWPLADVAPFWKNPLPGVDHGKTAADRVAKWGSRFTGHAPFHTRQIYQLIDAPQLVGIINVTPDSFSDGGNFLDPEKALKQALHLVESGAEIIDVGAESTAPHVKALSADTEWKRLEPVLANILATKDKFIITPKISVDTRFAETAQKALLMGADWINDVTGLQDVAMQEVVAQTKATCIIMHHVRIPEDRNHMLPPDQDSVALIYDWGARRIETLVKAGIAQDNIIFDPGIGFGNSADQAVQLIKHVDRFKPLGTRLLVGHSRKSFLSLFTAYAPAERDIETLALSLYLARQNVDYLRVHHVEMCARGFRMQRALL